MIKAHKYVEEKNELYSSLIEFLENSDVYIDGFKHLIKIINIEQIEGNREEIEHFLYLIHHISNNHQRSKYFFQKIFQIIEYYKDQIKRTFSNIEIFNIFRSNKLILLFLFENRIIKLDDQIYQQIIDTIEGNGNRFCHFFYPEIKEFLGSEKVKDIETELFEGDSNIFNNFEEKRHKGENDSYICSLIRSDSVEEFISYVNRTNIYLKSEIKLSIFESNSFLSHQNPTLIEYSAFYGSIQIFQYLQMNNVELRSDLWLYSIHSHNSELIHLLEYNKVKPPDDRYETCFIESIKCHHNDIAKYIKEKFLTTNMNDEIYSCILHYHNYVYLSPDYQNDVVFHYLCYYHYQQLVNLTYTKSESANIYETIEKVEDNRFAHSKLKRIVIPSSVKSIGNKAFNRCSSLTSISLSPFIESIGDNAFNRCLSLTSITIPQSVRKIGNHAFCGCSSLQRIKILSFLESIGNCCFKDCSSLIQITIPPSVASIGDYAFSGCSSLKGITIPSSATTIGKFAFSGCSSLKRITIPSSATTIGKSAFSGCSSLKIITIPRSVDSIEMNSFCRCESFKQITIPSSVKSICDHSFSGCSLLREVVIPSSVEMIGNYSFFCCKSLVQITIPSSVVSIGDEAFYKCSSLNEIRIPSSVKFIGKSCFNGCSLLTLISISSSSIESIEISSFYNCSSLVKFEIPSSVSAIKDYAFGGCSSLKEIVIPSSVKSIGYSAFNKCSSLVMVEIPSSVELIGDYAFNECVSLKKIIIPSSVSSIGENALNGCLSLYIIK